MTKSDLRRKGFLLACGCRGRAHDRRKGITAGRGCIEAEQEPAAHIFSHTQEVEGEQEVGRVRL